VSGDFWTPALLAARREWRERTRARSYRVSTILLVLAIVLAVGIPALVNGSSDAAKVGVLGGGARAGAVIRQAGRILDTKVAPVPVSSLASGRAQLRSGRLAVVYDAGGRHLYIHQRPAAGASGTAPTSISPRRSASWPQVAPPRRRRPRRCR
jgi:hypothetical protein